MCQKLNMAKQRVKQTKERKQKNLFTILREMGGGGGCMIHASIVLIMKSNF